MANGLYVNYRNLRSGGGNHTFPDWNTDTMKVVGIDHTDDTPNLTADEDWADRASGGRVGTATLASVTIGTVAAGVVDCADPVMSTVTGDQFESLDWYKDSGVESTSALCLNIDTATGLPCTPNGANITIVIHASGLFQG